MLGSSVPIGSIRSYGVCTMNEEYINEVAKAKGLSSNRSLRIAIKKGKYIAREVTVQGGKSYEIKYSSLEVEVQEKLENEEIKTKSTALIPINNINNNRILYQRMQD